MVPIQKLKPITDLYYSLKLLISPSVVYKADLISLVTLHRVVKVAVHPRGPRRHCVIYLRTYSTRNPRLRLGTNSPAIHSTVFIRRLRLRELQWSAGTHAKALPSNDERRARRLVQRDGSP